MANNTNFQTCLFIRYGNVKRHKSLLGGLQTRIRTWICKKERVVAEDVPELRSFNGTTHYKFAAGALCNTLHYVERKGDDTVDTKAWAVRYVHWDSQYKTTRKWIVDVGLYKVNEDLCLMHVSVEHAITKLSLVGEGERDPKPNVPGFVTKLLTDKRHVVYLANAEGPAMLPIRGEAFPLPVDSAAGVNILYERLIKSMLRKYVIIVANGDYKAEAEAKELHKRLKFKALVVYIPKSSEIREALEEIPVEDRVPYNHVGVFFPVQLQDRNIKVPCDSMSGVREDMIDRLLSNYPLENTQAIKSLDDVGILITLHRARTESNETLAKDNENLRIANEKLQTEYEQFVELAGEENTRLTNANTGWRDKFTKLKNLYDTLKVSSVKTVEPGYILENSPYPGGLVGILRFFEHIFSNRIVVHEKAYQSADDYDNFKEFDKAWELLTALALTLYDMKFTEGRFDDKAFINRTNVELAMTEGPMTMKDAKLMKLREREYKGKTYYVTPHLKYSNDRNKLLRVHFAFIEEEKKILVGHCGVHIPTAATRNLK